jgi:hypothetical protein
VNFKILKIIEIYTRLTKEQFEELTRIAASTALNNQKLNGIP